MGMLKYKPPLIVIVAAA